MANLWRDMQTYMNPNIDLGLTIQGETAEQKRKRELDAHLKSASQLSFGPLAPQDNREKYTNDYGIDPGLVAALDSYNKKATGKEAWYPGSGSGWMPNKLYTNVRDGGSVKGVWNF